MNLPKQWKHWCVTARLRPHAKGWSQRRRRCGAWLYLRGHGRVWRVNDQGQLQCGDTYVEFDRWALCDIGQAPMPTSRDQFVATVRRLLQAHSGQEASCK